MSSDDTDAKKAFNRKRFAHGALFRKKSTRKLSRGAAILGQELCQHYKLSEGGACVKSLRELAREIEVHENSARVYLKELRDAGLVTLEEREGQASRILMAFPSAEQLEEHFRRKAEEKANRRAAKAATPTEKRGEPLQKTVGVEKVEPLQENGGNPYSSMEVEGILSSPVVGGAPEGDPSRASSCDVESYDSGSPFNDGAPSPDDGAEERPIATPRGAAPPPVSAAEIERVWLEIRDSWAWSDSGRQSRRVFDALLEIISPPAILKAFHAAGGGGDELTPILKGILAKHRRVA